MRISTKTLLLAALPTITLAATLQDFTPRIPKSELTSQCLSIYTSEIDGCSGSDFTDGCSKSCVVGLQALVSKVKGACSGVRGENIVVAFLAGQGPQSLCPNAPAVLAGTRPSGSLDAAPSSTSSSRSRRIPSPSTKSIPPTSAVISGTATASTLMATGTASPSGGISLDGPVPMPSSVTEMSSATRTSSSNGSLRTGSHGSGGGGGSPFDNGGNLNSAAATIPWSHTMTLLAAAVALSAMLQ